MGLAQPRVLQRKRLGEMLVEEGLLTKQRLEQIIKEANRAGVRLGRYLVRYNLLTEQQIVQALSRQLNIQVFDPANDKPDTSLISLVPEELARKQHLAPLKRVNGLLYLVMVDPTDMMSLDLVMEQTRLDVEPMICTEAQLTDLMRTLYGKNVLADEESLRNTLMNLDSQDLAGEVEEQRDDEAMAVHTLQNMAEDAPVVRLVNSLLASALQQGTSDVHITPFKDRLQVRFRIDGVLQEAPAPPKSMFLPLVSRIKILSRIDISISRIPQDGRFTFRLHDREVSVRTSTVPTIYGEKVVLRLLDQSHNVLELEQLGMRELDMKRLLAAMRMDHGMILATGPTGSGKTTLLHAILKRINQPGINITTLEDPVEFRLDGVAQIQLNPKAGMTFASGLRAVLRQDPDVLMVGEIRDHETAEIAVQAALTGHKLLSTLHTNDAPGAVTRLTEMGLEPFLISSTVLMAVAQRLVRVLCPECKRSVTPTDEQQEALQYTPEDNFYVPEGCPSCNGTGYKGRVGVYELLPITKPIRQLILRGASSDIIGQLAVKHGLLRTLAMDAADKVKKGVTSYEEYLKVVSGWS